ncbi:MAG: hypothetical protein K0V04_07720 [Deltaproteobacteria bacterium]|nr:hypothetical protein [Deltaproteobacteria bacterium]
MRRVGLCIGFFLGLTSACDNEPQPETSCVDWLRCHVDCRDQQYARGDDQALSAEDLHQICVSQCAEIRAEVRAFSPDYETAVQAPDDVGFFWESMSQCLNDGA